MTQDIPSESAIERSPEEVLKPQARQQPQLLKPIDSGLVLRETTSEEHLPSIRPWVRAVGLFLVGSFSLGVGLTAIWPYRVVVRGQGQIRPLGESSVIHSPFTGRVNAVRVQDDQSVVRGQVIAELNAEDLRGKQSELNLNRKALGQQEQAIILQNRAAVEAASEDVEKAEAALRLAESEFSRYSQLADSGAIASIQLDEKRANLEVAKSNVEKARQSVKELVSQRQRDLSRLSQEVSTNLQESEKVKRDLGITLVRSPVSGVIHSLALRNPAQVVVEGQELARVAPVNREILAKVFIPAESIDDIEIGQTADLRIIGCPFPDFGTMKGRVISISPDAVSAQTAQQIQPSPSSSAQATESYPRYEVTVQPSGRTLESGSRKCELKLGMDFEADITTRIETVMTFLLRKARLIAGR